MIKFVLYLLTALFLLSCITEKGDVAISIKRKKSATSTSTTLSNASISSVQVINNQLVISGVGLDEVETVKVNGNSLNENFSIETKTATKIIANSIRAFSFDVSKVFNLILSDANASATFAIDFSLCNATLNGKGFNCSAPVADKDVLAYDAVSGTWKPRPASGLNYLGTFDASSNPASGPAIGTAGAYYVISDDGLIGAVSFAAGDWLVSNGTAWQKIDNSTSILSVFGRNGAITAQEGDYNLNLLTDVNIPTTPATGKVLKFDGTHWVAGDDLSGGGAGSVTTASIADGSVTDAKIVTVAASKITGTLTSAQIADGTIMNADVNAAAAIDYSKLNIPAGSIPYAKLNIADGDIPAAKISGLPSATSVLATTIVNADSTHAPDGNAVFDALALKLNLTGGTLSVGTIRGVPGPLNLDDVVNKQYTDTNDALKVSKSGDTMTGDLTIDADLKIKGGSNYVTVKGHATSTAYDLTLPANKGTSGYVLSTDGNGNTSWVDVTSSITSLDTDDVAEGSRLYFTEARVLGTDLAGLNTGVAGPIAAADTVLGAMGKLQYQVTDLKAKGQWDKNINDISYSAGNVEIDTKLRLKDSASNYVELKAPATVTTTYTLTFPANDGNVNQVLRTDGSGVLTWVDVSDSSVQAYAKVALPTCAAGEVLKSNGTSFACITDNAGAGSFSGTASKVVVTNAGGTLDVSGTSSTEIGYVSGVTSSIQTQLNSKEAAIAAGTAAQYLNGDKTFVTLDTSAVPENTRLYFTEPRVLATDLLGFVASNSAIVATDTVLTGLEKSQGQITNLGSTKANIAGDTFTGDVTFNTQVRLKDGAAGSFVTIKAPASGTTSHTLTLPGTVGTSGQVLSMTGTAGVLAWTTPASTTAPSGTAGGDLSGTFPNPTITALDAAKVSTGVVDNTEFDYLNGVTSSIQTQLNNKQATDATLTSLSAFNTNGIIVQTAVDTFAGRSIAGTANRVVVTNGDGVAANPTLNISTTLLPSPVVGDVGKYLKVTAADTSVWTALSTGDITTALGFTPINKGGDSLTSGTFTLSGAAVLRTLDPIGLTDVANKQYVDGKEFFTESKVLATALTGFSASNSAIVATDTVLAGFGKAQGQITNLGTIKANIAGDTFTGDVTFNTQVRLKDGATANYVTLKAPASGTTSHTLTLPGTVGTSGQVLSMTGTAGVLAWTTPSTTATPTGAAGGDLSGTYPNPTIASLDATKIATGVVDNTEFNYLNGVTSSIQAQLNAKQATDATLTSLAAYNTNGILVQTAADTFVGRSIAGTANRVVVTNGDGVAANPTLNVSTTLLPSPVVGDVGKYLKATAADTSVWTALSSSDITTALGFTPINKAGDSLTTGVITLSGAAVLRTPNPIGLTDVANKQYVDDNAHWTLSGGNVYRSTGKVAIGTTTPVGTLSVEATLPSIQMKKGGAAAVDTINFINDMDATGFFWISKGAAVTAPTSANKLVSLTNEGNLEIYGQQVNTTDASGVLSLKTQASGDGGTKNEVSMEFYADRADLNTSSGFLGFESGTAFDMSLMNIKSGNLIFGTSNAARMRINSTGDVGIGTTSPDQRLHVSSSASSAQFVLERTGASAGKAYLGADNLGFHIFDSSYNRKVTVDPSGNVGIGTSSPMARFDIRNGAINRSIQLVPSIDNSAANGSKIEFRQNDNGNVNALYASIQGHLQNGATGYNAGELIFNTAPLGTGNPAASERMRITSAGDVGIGTAVPNLAAETNGRRFLTIKGVGTTASTGAGIIQLTSNSVEGNNTNLGNIEWHDSTNSSANQRSGYISMFTNGATANNRGTDMTFATRPDNGTAAVDRLRITSAGLVGVNTVTPSSMFEVFAGDITIKAGTTNVNDPGDLVFRDNAGAEKARVYSTGAAGGGLILSGRVSPTGSDLVITSTGAVGIGTASPSYGLHVNGSVAGTGAYNALSDMRLKKDITVIPNSLEKIEKLRGVSFNWRKDVHPEFKLGDKGEIGVIAQEVKKVFPEAITVDKKTGILSVAYSMLIAPLIEAVKELFHDSKIIKREIASLKSENKELKAKNDQMAAYLCKKDPAAPFCTKK